MLELNECLDQILKDKQAHICVLGDTLNPDKYAYKIKQGFVSRGYQNLYCIDKEITSLDLIPSAIDLIVLCMHPEKAYNLLSASKNQFKCALFQPGAHSEKLESLLQDNNTNCYQGCILVY